MRTDSEVPASMSEHDRDAASRRSAPSGRVIRPLFIDAQYDFNAPMAVHVGLMRSFAPDRAFSHLICNSQGGGTEAIRSRLDGARHVRCQSLPLGLPRTRLVQMSRFARMAALAPLPASILRAAAYARRERVDLIHTSEKPRDILVSASIARAAGRPFLVHMHSVVGDYLTRPTLWGLRHAPAVIAVSEHTARRLAELGVRPDVITVVHNSVDTVRFSADPWGGERARIRRAYGVPDDAILFGMVARIDGWKGHRELVEAVAAVRDWMPPFRVIFLGAGPAQAEVERQIDERRVGDVVTLAGWLADVRPVLASLDAFVLSSCNEPCSLAILEAMSMGLPVVACRSGGTPELIDTTEAGVLVEPGSIEELAAALRRLATDPAFRRALGSRARTRAVECFAPQRQADRVWEVYRGLLASLERSRRA